MSTVTKTKKEPDHYDIFGHKIEVGMYVVTANSMTGIMVGRISKLNPKMVKVSSVRTKYEYNRYPSEVCIVEGEEVSLYLLSSK